MKNIIETIKILIAIVCRPWALEDISSSRAICALLQFRHRIHLLIKGMPSDIKIISVSEIDMEKRPDVFICREWLAAGFPDNGDYVDFMLHEKNRKNPKSLRELQTRCRNIVTSFSYGYLFLYFPAEFVYTENLYMPLNTIRTATLLASNPRTIYGRVIMPESLEEGQRLWKYARKDFAWSRINRFIPDRSTEIHRRIAEWRQKIQAEDR